MLLTADHGESVAAGSGVGGGMTTKETIVKGSSSASFVKGQHEMCEVDGRWEEHRNFISAAVAQVTGTTGANIGAETLRSTRVMGSSRDMAGARTAAVAVSEEFLGSYFAEVRVGFYICQVGEGTFRGECGIIRVIIALDLNRTLLSFKKMFLGSEERVMWPITRVSSVTQ